MPKERWSADRPLTPEATVALACPLIGALGSCFYFYPRTLATGRQLGLDALHFYYLGRGGVLGDVDAPVVTSAFGFFNPELVARMWEEGRRMIAPPLAASAYFNCSGHVGRDHLGSVEGLEAFCDAARTVKEAADPAGLALFAGINGRPLDDDPAPQALQLTTVLRELRGSAHLLAVLATGLSPRVAHYLRRPRYYPVFGWDAGAPPAVTAGERQALDEAEALTDRLVLAAFSALDADGAAALVGGLERMRSALSAAGLARGEEGPHRDVGSV